MIICSGIILPLVAVVAAATSSACNTGLHNAQGINFWKLHHRTASASTVTSQQHRATHPANREQQVPLVTSVTTRTATTEAEAVSSPVTPKFRAQTFTQPLDHFRNTTDATFQQRFWVNARHYKPRPGAPVIVIDGGETSGEDRLPFLDTGIADLLARATGGVGVVLEHRYYGACLTHVSLHLVLCPPPGLVGGFLADTYTNEQRARRPVYWCSGFVDGLAQVRASSYVSPPFKSILSLM